MALEAQNNPFTSVLMVEAADPEAIGDADPSAGSQRLVVGAYHLLYLLDSTGTATLVGSGGSGDITTDAAWAAKGDLIVATGNDAASVQTVGANDTILMADSSQTRGVKWVGSQTPSTQAFSDAAAEGTADTYARGDHKHAMPANPGGGGALVLLEQHTASNSATLDFTAFISSTYDTYKIIGSDITPASNAVDFRMQVGTGGGPTWDTTGGNYNGGGGVVDMTAGGALGSWADAAGAGMKVLPSLSNNAGYGFGNFDLLACELQSTAHRKSFNGTALFVTSTPQALAAFCGYQWLTTGTAATGLRFLFSSGNIASGTVRVYGVAK